jgi:septum formation protein
MAMPRLVLASASPRRLELLRQLGLKPDAIEPTNIDELPRPDELPREAALRLAREKADRASARHPGAVVLAADTIVACGRRMLPKAEIAEEAISCLRLLSGRRHRVHGAIVVIATDGRHASRFVTTVVAFKRLTGDEIDAYIASGEWRGKAGGYAIQGRASAFVRQINGSYGNVVGLDLFAAAALLRGAGLEVPVYA